MGVNTISVEQRYYLGHFREGTVFNSFEDYLVDGEKVSVYVTKRFYCGRAENGSNKFGFSHVGDEFVINEQDREELARIIEQIKVNPDTKYSADHYKKGVFDRRRFDYFAVVIDGAHYELNKSDAELAGGLLRILRVNELLDRCQTGYDTLEQAMPPMEEKKEPEEESEKILLEKPEVHEPEKILAKNEDDGEEQESVQEIVIEMKDSEPKEKVEAEDKIEAEVEAEEKPIEEPKPAKGGFHRELLTKPNHANWNQVAGKY